MKIALIGTALLAWAIPAFGQAISPTANCQSGTGIPGYISPGVPTSIELNSLSQLPSAPSYGTPPSITPTPPSNFSPPPSFTGMGSSFGTASGIGAIGTSGIGSIGTGVGSVGSSGVGRMGTTGIGSIGSAGIGVPSGALSPPPSFVRLTPMPALGSSTRVTNAYITPPPVVLPRASAPCR